MQIETFKILLLSGGADSMLLYQRYKYDRKIFFKYGQRHCDNEFEICRNIIDKTIILPSFVRRNNEVNCRNINFILNIVSVYGNKDLDIYIGTNRGDVYKDNNRRIFDEFERFINKISFNRVSIKTPLMDMSKDEILKELNLRYYTD